MPLPIPFGIISSVPAGLLALLTLSNPWRADVNRRDEYFARFAPWENEQFAFIHDYLFGFLDLGMVSTSFSFM